MIGRTENGSFASEGRDNGPSPTVQNLERHQWCSRPDWAAPSVLLCQLQDRDGCLLQITFFEACESRHRAKVTNDNPLIHYCRQTFLTQAPDHSVDMRLTKSEHIGHQLLRQRQCVGEVIAKANRAKPHEQFEEQMSEVSHTRIYAQD